MKIFFWKITEDANTTYSFELIKYIAKAYGHVISLDHAKCDIIAINCNNVAQFDDITKIRKQTKKPIVVGGAVCTNAYSLLAYVDYINMGQGYQFFKECNLVKDIADKEYILTKDKKEIVFSQYIDWSLIPVVKIAKKSYSYLYSIGCKNKCSYCLTSWTNKHQTNPNYKKIKFIRQSLPKGCQLYLITNDYDGGDVKRKVSDVEIKKYIAMPEKFKNISKVRFGIEFPTEDQRKKFKKPMLNEEIKTAFQISKKYNQTLDVFFIAGLNNQQDFFDFGNQVFNKSYDTSPKIGFIFNYIVADNFTPIEKLDMSKIKKVDLTEIRVKWRSINDRVRLYRSATILPYYAIHKTMINRAHWTELDKVKAFHKKNTFASVDDLCKKAKNNKLDHLLYFRNFELDVILPYKMKRVVL